MHTLSYIESSLMNRIPITFIIYNIYLIFRYNYIIQFCLSTYLQNCDLSIRDNGDIIASSIRVCNVSTFSCKRIGLDLAFSGIVLSQWNVFKDVALILPSCMTCKLHDQFFPTFTDQKIITLNLVGGFQLYLMAISWLELLLNFIITTNAFLPVRTSSAALHLNFLITIA